MDIFSLQYFKITPLNPFEANVPFLYPLKWVKKVEYGKNNIYSIRKFRKAPQHTHSINQCSLLQVSVLSYARSISFHLYLKTFALSLFATDCFLRYVDQWCSLYIYYIFLSLKCSPFTAGETDCWFAKLLNFAKILFYRLATSLWKISCKVYVGKMVSFLWFSSNSLKNWWWLPW